MKGYKIGLQLYSVRDSLAKDLEGGLKAIKAMGYDYCELAGYYDLAPQELAKLLSGIGLQAVSAHISIDDLRADLGKQVTYLQAMNVKICAVPWISAEKFVNDEGVEELAQQIIEISRNLKAHGIKLVYHNHDFELVNQDESGDTALDRLLSRIEGYCDAEPDTCWIKYAGYDPIKFLEKYKGRTPVVHIKDFYADSASKGHAAPLNNEGRRDTEADNFAFRPLGQGVQDIKAIIDAAVSAGAEYIVVEQDNSYDLPPLQAAQQSIEYLKKIL